MRSLPVIVEPPRPRHLPTASALGRVFECVASESKPHSYSTSEHATRGTVIHAFIVRARAIGREAALAEIPEDEPHRAFLEALPLDELPAGGDLELPLAWDHVTDTARILPSKGQRDYSDVKLTEFALTSDYVGKQSFDGVLTAVVGDWKTGRRYLGPAGKSRQLRIGALAAARLIGAEAARVSYVFLRDDGTYRAAWASFDALELAEIADEHRALVVALANPGPVHEGEWCDFCPAFNSCEAKIALAQAIGNGTALVDIEARIDSMTDPELGRVYLKLEGYDDIAERVRTTIRQRAAAHPIDLGDGRVLGTVQWPYTVVNASIAREVIAAAHDVALAEEICPRTTTLTAVKKLGKSILAEIERRGGLITGKKPQVRVSRKKENDK